MTTTQSCERSLRTSIDQTDSLGRRQEGSHPLQMATCAATAVVHMLKRFETLVQPSSIGSCINCFRTGYGWLGRIPCNKGPTKVQRGTTIYLVDCWHHHTTRACLDVFLWLHILRVMVMLMEENPIPTTYNRNPAPYSQSAECQPNVSHSGLSIAVLTSKVRNHLNLL